MSLFRLGALRSPRPSFRVEQRSRLSRLFRSSDQDAPFFAHHLLGVDRLLQPPACGAALYQWILRRAPESRQRCRFHFRRGSPLVGCTLRRAGRWGQSAVFAGALWGDRCPSIHSLVSRRPSGSLLCILGRRIFWSASNCEHRWL